MTMTNEKARLARLSKDALIEALYASLTKRGKRPTEQQVVDHVCRVGIKKAQKELI